MDIEKGNIIYEFLKRLNNTHDLVFADLSTDNPNICYDGEIKDYIKEHDIIRSKKLDFDYNALVYITQNGRNILKFKNWEEYIENISNNKNSEFQKEKVRQDLRDEIDRLTKVNLELQNKQMKRYVVYSIIAFILGAIITNVKDILILLNLMIQ